MNAVRMHWLKARLAEFVRRAEQGEEFVITRRNKPIARLLPHCAEESRSDENIAHIVAEMLAIRDARGPMLGPRTSVRQLIEEGRRT
jgi:prevent-host-death family protein